MSSGVGRADGQLSADEFEPKNYPDEYRARVKAMLEEKSRGLEIVTAPAPVRKEGGQVVELIALLKASMEKSGERATAQKKTANRTKQARHG